MGELLQSARVVAVFRGSNADTVFANALAAFGAGVRVLEVTQTIPAAPRLVERLIRETDAVVGAGSVRTAADVDAFADAGARFVMSPVCRHEIIDRAHAHGIAAIPGAMTPTEVLAAWDWGADLVKLFPAARLGPAYLKDLHGPMPDIPLVPTGGITGDNLREYLEAGAAAVCIGSWLSKGTAEKIRQRARQVAAEIDAFDRRSTTDGD